MNFIGPFIMEILVSKLTENLQFKLMKSERPLSTL